MGYHALLFCPEEKTARTVTQVLNELEFSVETCTEPFAAVKKLMAEHFDAVVVDCDNEQNATLLFKSARNSASNQTSLAVAVVEGQAGVAKAFRIGANLVLTKPINVEQAKGTLRVARGLLRKGDPAKPAGPATSTPAQAKTSSAAPSAPKPTVPLAPTPAAKLATPPGFKPAQAVSAKTAPAPAGQTPAAFEPDVLDVDSEPPATPAAARSIPSPSFSKTSAPIGGIRPSGPAHSVGLSSGTGAGAASAPAPARVAAESLFEQPATAGVLSTATTSGLDKESHASESSTPAPSFTFGGANAPEPKGGSKKAIIGVAAAALIAGVVIFGWTHFHGKSAQSSPATPQPASTGSTAPPSTLPSKPEPTLSSSPATSAAPAPRLQPATVSNSSLEKPEASIDDEEAPEKAAPALKSSPKKTNAESPASTKPAEENKPAQQPLMVKNGAAAAGTAKAVPAADAPAPSVLDIAPAASGDGLPNLIPDSNAPKPVLQTLNVSQGVSQGLLIKKVQPTYPATALRMHVEGSVLLSATIGKNGSITSIKILSGEPLLAQAALDAVKQWKYKPYFLNGEPVEIQTQVTVNFKLPR